MVQNLAAYQLIQLVPFPHPSHVWRTMVYMAHGPHESQRNVLHGGSAPIEKFALIRTPTAGFKH